MEPVSGLMTDLSAAVSVYWLAAVDDPPLCSAGELCVPEKGPQQDQGSAPADGGRPEDG